MANMDFGSLLQAAFPSASPNNTDSTNDLLATLSPTNLLETFVPGYGLVHKFLLLTLGFDVTVVVSLAVAIYLGSHIIDSFWRVIWRAICKNYVAEVVIYSTEDVHSHLSLYFVYHHRISASRHLIAKSFDDDSEGTANVEPNVAETTGLALDGNIKWLNFSNQAAKAHPYYTPAYGGHHFYQKGTFFHLQKDRIQAQGPEKSSDKLTISCFGRSTEPIKNLIQDARVHYYQLSHNTTVIRRPSPKESSHMRWWETIAKRPCRPLQTVVLDEARKIDVLVDINEYLDPATARWYASRGIPYRRGYLFHGPPGTGKTSLTFALAGFFGLGIYVISLLDPGVTENDFVGLFSKLPPRCIVLLEDIDSAGLARLEPSVGEDAEEGEKPQEQGMGKEDSVKWEDLKRALKKGPLANGQNGGGFHKGISLSGLLNIIDGVASHEGRILIMTTNHPEKLDQALIRPGRVDHQVAFYNASQGQAKEIFERMYANETPFIKTTSSSASTKPPSTDIPKSSTTTEKKTHLTSSENTTISTDLLVLGDGNISTEELSDIARKFAELIPDGTFSPAEIQGFLLKRKNEPKKALREAEEWVTGTLEQKKRGSRLVTVQ